MSTSQPEIFAGDNLSRVWASAFLNLVGRNEDNTPPFLVSINGFNKGTVIEDLAIKAALDAELARHECGLNCDEVAFTIFPHSFWNPAKPPQRRSLFETYMRAYPRLIKRSRSNHKGGTYFQRLIAYAMGGVSGENINQLDKVLEIWNSPNKRHSGLQACCFDPIQDHKAGPYLSFPCLQQISFDHDKSGGLSINAFYATQYFFLRAYGNYLGLCNLGRFMAHEMGLTLVRMNCFVGAPRTGLKTKNSVSNFAANLKQHVMPAPTQSTHV